MQKKIFILASELEPFHAMNIITQTIFSNDFDHLKSILNSDECVNINQWKIAENFAGLKDIKIQNCCFAKKPGVYAIIDNDGDVAYIGKANCLHDRLSSHSKALTGGEEHKAAAWHQFFSWHNGKNLTAKYFIIDGFSDETSDRTTELAKQAIERALQMKYRPYFDLLYKKKKYKIDDFEVRLEAVKKTRCY